MKLLLLGLVVEKVAQSNFKSNLICNFFLFKDSTVLAHVLNTLNQKYSYNLKLILLSVDEGITGYRDDSLESVKRNQIQYNLPLKVVTYEELYGWTMDDIVKKVGLKNNCKYNFNG
jgi:cytoplasmic tRNA 2-thiolation protein 1